MKSRTFLCKASHSLMLLLTLVWPMVQPLKLHATDFYTKLGETTTERTFDSSSFSGTIRCNQSVSNAISSIRITSNGVLGSRTSGTITSGARFVWCDARSSNGCPASSDASSTTLDVNGNDNAIGSLTFGGVTVNDAGTPILNKSANIDAIAGSGTLSKVNPQVLVNGGRLILAGNEQINGTGTNAGRVDLNGTTRNFVISDATSAINMTIAARIIDSAG